MRVLGLDPGYGRIGWGLVRRERGELKAESWGLIETDPSEDWPDRLVRLFDAVSLVYDECKPEVIAAEELWFGANRTTALAVAKAAGILSLAAAQRGIEYVEYKPSTVKMTVTGSGSARKPKVREMVRRLLGLKDLRVVDDVSDALAVAICHLQHSRIPRR
ncbi:MAG: crossover junction endodeoxyribonuclease RuvC [Armatimonadetes bacterium]|nr:MAG: crossover junction endodeoxyribonuclease RuvC [Armatimonadota bacterium]